MIKSNPGLPLLAAAALSLAAGGAAFAQGSFYVVTETNRLGTVNVSTGAYSDIGALGTLLTDIAVAPDGSLYGVDFENLFSINPITGQATLIGSSGLGARANLNALVFRNNTLFAADVTTFGLYTLSTTTGAASLIGTSGFQSAGDLAFDNLGNLYLTSLSNELVKLDPTNGTGVSVGSFGASFGNMYGLAFQPSGSLLYGYSYNANQIVTLDRTTGTAVFSAVNQGPRFYGSAFIGEALVTNTNAPEPSTLALALFGTGAFGIARRRRRRA